MPGHGKGFNNYMCKKFFHPGSYDNLKRKWMAEQKDEFDKQKQAEAAAQYAREQEIFQNRAQLGDQKAKMGLSFMYDPPAGASLGTKTDAMTVDSDISGKNDAQKEVKFEWQKKYNAPREAYLGDMGDTILDQPFGIEVKNIRCMKCKKWGHVNTDKICPLYDRSLTADPSVMLKSNATKQRKLDEGRNGGVSDKLENNDYLMDAAKKIFKKSGKGSGESEDDDDDSGDEKDKDILQGIQLKRDLLEPKIDTERSFNEILIDGDSQSDKQIQFLNSLTDKQRKKLLKKLKKLKKKEKKEKKHSSKR